MMTRWNRWNPFEEINAIQREIGNIFNRFSGSTEAAAGPTTRMIHWIPPMEAFYHNNALVLRCFLPGVDPKTVDVSVTDSVLTIKGERRLELEIPRDDYLFSEVAYGTFERTLTVPQALKSDQVAARYYNGVLEIRIPVAEGTLPRKVNVEIVAPDEKVLAGSTR